MAKDTNADGRLRWRLAEEEEQGDQDVLFDRDELVEHHIGTGEYAGMEFLHVNARRIINEVPASSRMPFRHTINVYRGCSHACTYCFARPTHEYLGLNAGDDFDRRIVVKVNAVSVCGRSWRPVAGPATRWRWVRTPIPTSDARASST